MNITERPCDGCGKRGCREFECLCEECDRPKDRCGCGRGVFVIDIGCGYEMSKNDRIKCHLGNDWMHGKQREKASP